MTSSSESPLSAGAKPSFSPYLNINPNFLNDVDDEYILLEDAGPVRSRVQVMFSMVGGSTVLGAMLGGADSMRYSGLKLLRGKSERMQTTSAVLKNGGKIASKFGSIAVLYYVCSIICEKSRGVEDDVNTVVGGATAGALYSLPSVLNVKKDNSKLAQDIEKLGLFRRNFMKLPPFGRLITSTCIGLLVGGLLSFNKNQVTNCLQNITKRS